MASMFSRSRHLSVVVSAATLLLLTFLYWKFRIIETAVPNWTSLNTGDLYTQYYPMVSYGFSSLRAGRLPMWNPFQLCGVPFLGVPYVGLFYPGNVFFLFSDVSTAIEAAFIFHMFFAAVSMWWLQRRFGIASLGGICSAITFAWSGWLIFNANQIPLYAGMAWMPLTVLLFDRASVGQRGASVGVIVAVGCQLLLGATETLVHNVLVGAVFASARLATVARKDGWAAFLRRSCVLAACTGAGALLAAIQLLPTIELTGLSNRSGALAYSEAVAVSRPVLWVLMNAMGGPAKQLGVEPSPVAGVLPFLALFIAYRNHTSRWVWFIAVGISVVSLLLVSGDPFYQLYYAMPWGAMFRRPEKLLSIYQFGLALLAGLAISQLQSWRALPRSELWTSPGWLASLALLALLGAISIGWSSTVPNVPTAFKLADVLTLQTSTLISMLALLVVYGCITSSRGRTGAVVCLVVMQATNLFFATGSKTDRPISKDLYGEQLALKHYVRDVPDYYRTYLFYTSSALPVDGFRQKDGTMHGFEFVSDYDSLVLARYQAFFNHVNGAPRNQLFTGGYRLSSQSRWRMMRLTGTKHYIASTAHPANGFINAIRPHGPNFRRTVHYNPLTVYETEDVLPRAYVVHEARVIEDPDRLLDALDDSAFDPRREVLLEKHPDVPSGKSPEEPYAMKHPEMWDWVKIEQYQPEEVTIDVFSMKPGYLVLSDAFYPGWKAFVNGKAQPIYRANYLFRAVRLEAGSNTVVFSYQPTSFRAGALLTGVCVTLLAIVTGYLCVTWARSYSTSTCPSAGPHP